MTRPPLPADAGVDPTLASWLDEARADLAAHLDVEPNSVQVTVAAPVTWPDSSCGCPEPGMGYLQVMTDGAYAELVVDGTTYAYHSGGHRGPFRCEPRPGVG